MLNGRKIQTFRSHIRADQHVLSGGSSGPSPVAMEPWPAGDLGRLGALLEGSDGFMAFLLIQAAVDGHNLRGDLKVRCSNRSFQREFMVNYIELYIRLHERACMYVKISCDILRDVTVRDVTHSYADLPFIMDRKCV